MNSPKSDSSQASSGENTIQTNSDKNGSPRFAEPLPRKVGFVTVKPLTEKKLVAQQQSLNSNPDPSYVAHPSTVTQSGVAMATAAMATQPRRVNFTTLQPGKSSSLVQGKTASYSQSLNANSSNSLNTQPLPCTASERKSNAALVQQPRRVGFVTLQSSKSSTLPQRSPNVNPTHSSTSKSELNPPVARDEKQECTPTPQPLPRRVNFVTIQPPQTSPATKQIQKVSQIVPVGQTPNPISATNNGACNTVGMSSDSPNTAVPGQDRPPIPLEPKVIIIKE